MLARMLRYSLKQNNEMIYLEDAVNYIRNYLTFQKVRFRERVKFEINISEDIKKIKLPFMTIQPIIENSILHGLEPKADGGIIKIHGYKLEEDAVIQVSDNGVGINNQRLDSIKNSKEPSCLGISNVNKRLIHYYGSKYCLGIDSEVGIGTKVTIRIPIQ